MDLPSDCCDYAHALGYDHCPICQGRRPLQGAPDSPQVLLMDLEEQVRQVRDSGSATLPWQLDRWIALINQARTGLANGHTTP